MRMVRATMLEVLSLDYVRTARAKGVPRRTVIRKHALRNALIPVVTVVGFEVGVLISGAAIVEIIFGLPGVGYTLLHAIFQRDYPMIQAATLLIATVFVVVNFVVDILYGFLDPRISVTMTHGGRRLEGPARAEAARAAGALAQPDRHRRRRHRRLRHPDRALRPLHLDGRPERPGVDAAARPELGAPDGHGRARPRHARAHHPRRPGLAPGRRGRDLDRVRLRAR